tara:strand:+ start:1037 stop:1321 length:285 start_codon:yes stop_codon:yes gene_type:complete
MATQGNQSIEQVLKTSLFGLNSNLGVKTYCTTEDYRHALDYRLVLTFKGRNMIDLDCIDRQHYTNKRTNRIDRDERDEYVGRLLSRLTIKQLKG